MDITVAEVLTAVDRWAHGYWMVRETGIGLSDGQRIDALLVPAAWEAHCMRRGAGAGPTWQRPRLIGVEVKVSRGDYLRGVRNGQYERYAEDLDGLYLVVPCASVAKASELPAGVGYLRVHQGAVLCRRHPTYRQSEPRAGDAELAWRLLFEARRQMVDAIAEAEARSADALQRLGTMASEAAMAAAQDALQQVWRKPRRETLDW